MRLYVGRASTWKPNDPLPIDRGSPKRGAFTMRVAPGPEKPRPIARHDLPARSGDCRPFALRSRLPKKKTARKSEFDKRAEFSRL